MDLLQRFTQPSWPWFTVIVFNLRQAATIDNVENHFTRGHEKSRPIVYPLMQHGDGKTTTVTFCIPHKKDYSSMIAKLRNNNFIDDSGIYKVGIDDEFQGLSLLNRCEGEPQFDFYFIHGLNGHAYGTWNYESKTYGRDSMWARDILPNFLEALGNGDSSAAQREHGLQGRYFTFGYDANVLKLGGMAQSVEATAWNLLESMDSSPNETLHDKPKYFVCHSLGGLVTSHAMVLLLCSPEEQGPSARRLPEELKQKFFHSKTGECLVKGIFFFGTPFDGSWLATFAAPIISAFRCSETFLGNLKPKNKGTARTRASFLKGRDRAGCNISLVIFYEEKMMKQAGIHVPVTSRKSALADFKGDVRDRPIPRDHSQIVKYSGITDVVFTRFVGEEIRKIVVKTIANMEMAVQNAEQGLDQNFQIKQSPPPNREGPIVRGKPLRWWTRVTLEALEHASGGLFRHPRQTSDMESKVDALSRFEQEHIELFNNVLEAIMTGIAKEPDQTDAEQDLTNQLSDVRDPVAGTCDWLLDEPQYQRWEESETSRILFVEGGEGVGKSVLAKFLIGHLRLKFESASVAHFFCRGMSSENGHINILRRIIWQLEDQDPGIIRKTLKGRGFTSFGRQPDFEVLWRMFMAMTKETSKRVFCVIDGIDEFINTLKGDQVHIETGPVSTFLRQLCSFFISASPQDEVENATSTKSVSSVSIIFTTRPLPQVTAASQQFPNSNLIFNIDLEKIQARAQAMIKADIRELVETENLSGDLEDLVVRILSAKAAQEASPFQWVYTALEILRSYKSQSPGYTIDRLHEFLPGIHNMYFQTLIRISEDEKTSHLASKLFSMLIIAREDLELEAICDSLDLIYDDISSQDVQATIGACQGLIRISKRGNVEFNHPTVREFLQRLDPVNFPEFSCVAPECDHYEMTRICVRYLLRWPYRAVTEEDVTKAGGDEYMARARSSHFLAYAVLYWPAHAQGSGKKVVSLVPMIRGLLHPQGIEYFLQQRFRSMLYDEQLDAGWVLPHPAIILASWDLLYLLQLALPKSKGSRFGWPKQPQWITPPCLRKEDTSRLVFGLDLVSQDTYGCTLLHYAALNGSLKTMEHLLVLGSRGDVFDKNGHSPFSLAVSENQPAVATLLLNSNRACERKLESSGIVTSLHCATLYNMKDVAVYLLVSKMVDVDYRALVDGWTSLHVAAQVGNLEIAILLIEKGANTEAKKANGATPLLFAAENGHLNIIEALFEAKSDLDPAPRTESGWTPLHASARNGHVEAFKPLLNRQPVVEPDRDGVLPIHVAAENGHIPILECIPDNKDISALDRRGRQPIHKAAMNGHLNVIKDLIRRGAKPDAAAPDLDVSPEKPAFHCITPLYFALSGNHEDSVYYLLSKDIEVQKWRSATGESYLHVAARSKNEQLFLHFMEIYQLDPFLQADDGWTPFLVAVGKCGKRLVEKIWTSQWRGDRSIDETNKSGNSALHISMQDGNIETVRYILSLHPNKNLQTVAGSTAFMYSVLLEDTEILNLLAAEGVDMTLRGEFGSSAVGIAVSEGKPDVLEILHEYGVEMDTPNVIGGTPIQIAAERRRPECVMKLLEWGADAVAVNKLGLSVLDYAQGYSKILELPRLKELMTTYIPLPKEERDRMIRQCISELWARIPDKNSRNQDNPLWCQWLEIIGFLLFRLGREQDFCVCYEQQFRRLFDGMSRSSYICEKCSDGRYEEGFWQCRDCPEMSICTKCYKERDEGILAEGCSDDHSYVEVGGQAWKKLAPGTVNAQGDSFEKWFAKLQDEFA